VQTDTTPNIQIRIAAIGKAEENSYNERLIRKNKEDEVGPSNC
jgi:hypothetical protein